MNPADGRERTPGMMSATEVLQLPFRLGLVGRHDRTMALSSTGSDAEWVRLARQGDGEAVAALVHRYSGRLHRFVTRLIGDPSQAQDVLQETWLRVVERLDRYDPAQPFPVWLFVVARHLAVDALRRRSRERLGAVPRDDEEGEGSDAVERLADEAPSALDRLSEREELERLERLLAGLPAHYREVLALRFHDDLALDAIARIVRAPLPTVKTRLRRGLDLLRRRAERTGAR